MAYEQVRFPRNKGLVKRLRDKIVKMRNNQKKMLESDVEALCLHLRLMGLDATVESYENRRLGGFWSPQTIIGSVKVANRNIDLVELVHIRSSKEWGDASIPITLYRCQYVVHERNEVIGDIWVELKPIYRRFLSREIVDFKWEEKVWKSMNLAKALSSDPILKDLLWCIKNSVPLRLEIKPDRQHQCVRITQKGYCAEDMVSAFPAAQAFEAYDRIAQHIRNITERHSLPETINLRDIGKL